jgi:hypothetical protein
MVPVYIVKTQNLYAMNGRNTYEGVVPITKEK